MGKLLAAIDYSPASASALQALLPLRRYLRATLVVYHAYQLPRGLPFLSAHVIERMEREAEDAAQQNLRDFLAAHVSAADRRGIRVLAQRDFPSDGLQRHLEVGRYTLLALGAQGGEEEIEGALGFHARHFINHSPVPTLVAFAESVIAWKRILVAYDSQYRSPRAIQLLRKIASKGQTEIVGLPILRLNAHIERLHKRLYRLLRPRKYDQVLWKGAPFVELLLQAARSYHADIIALLMNSSEIVEGMQALSPATFIGGPAWLFLPQEQRDTEEEDSEEK
jgi:nucleotide-binding universal stress UspA family protein